MNDKTSTAETENVDATGQVTADTAEADKEKIAAAGLGKFGSVDALIAAYSSLEAEFTRRSQRLKELEQGNKAQDMPPGGAPSPKSVFSADMLDDGAKAAVIEQYLRSLSAGKSIPLIVEGASPSAPRVAPKTVKEAGALAQTFLKN